MLVLDTEKHFGWTFDVSWTLLEGFLLLYQLWNVFWFVNSHIWTLLYYCGWTDWKERDKGRRRQKRHCWIEKKRMWGKEKWGHWVEKKEKEGQKAGGWIEKSAGEWREFLGVGKMMSSGGGDGKICGNWLLREIWAVNLGGNFKFLGGGVLRKGDLGRYVTGPRK